MAIGDIEMNHALLSRRHFLLGVAAIAGSGLLAACGGVSTAGSLPSCADIKNQIADDNTQIAKLQRQKASTSYPPQVTHINQQIAAERDDIVLKQGQAREMKCP